MRRNYLSAIGLLAVALAGTGSGCASMNNTEKGAVGGGVVGTALGTAVGAATGKPLLGAAIGGLGGTATGALIGNGVDKDEARQREVQQAVALADAQAQQQQLGIAGVIGLAQQGHSDQIIINQIRSTRSTFQLTTADLDMLKGAGVSQPVIAEMQAARAAPVQPRVVVRDPRPTTIIYGPPPPPPVMVIARPRPYYGHGHFHYCP